MKNYKFAFLLIAQLLFQGAFAQGESVMEAKKVTSSLLNQEFEVYTSEAINAGIINRFPDDICSVDPRIVLYVDHYEKKAQAVNYDITLKVSIELIPDHNNPSYNSFIEKDLRLSYSNSEVYQDRVVYKLDNPYKALKMKVKVIEMTGSLAGVNNLRLMARIDVEKGVKATMLHPFFNSKATVINNELKVAWFPTDNIEEYQFEWVFKERVGNPVSQIVMKESDFAQKSTRIVTTKSYYKIPLIYGYGAIVWRVRAIYKDCSGKITYSPWSLNFGDSYSRRTVSLSGIYGINTAGFQPKQNWNATTFYTEGGRSKSVVNYHDGLLKSRQSVTKLNSTQNVVAKEIIYDEEGRAAISTIAAPTGNSSLEINPKLHLNSRDTAYSYADFESLTHLSNDAPSPFKNTSGAGKYYSPNNPQNNERDKDIPDAKGYPFNQIVYKNDGSGNISRIGGVGANHRIGSGHETKFYYEQPKSGELEKIFGEEVGDHKNYSKNISIDANGQVMVDYLDKNGRTIATGISGGVDTDQDLLPGSDSKKSTTTNLIGRKNGKYPFGANTIVDSESYKIVKPFNVKYDDVPSFNYSVTTGSYERTCEEGDEETTTCYDCVYKLKFTLVDVNWPERTFILNDSDLDEGLSSEVGVGTYNTATCLGGESFSTSIALKASSGIKIPPGEYVITKELILDEGSMNDYKDYFMSNFQCTKSLQSFIDEKQDEYDDVELDCEVTCAECQLFYKLGRDGINAQRNKDGEANISDDDYAIFKAECNSACAIQAIDCQTGYVTMLKQVSPGGQYGQFMDRENNVVNAKIFPLSVYNDILNNKLPRKRRRSLPNQVPYQRVTSCELSIGANDAFTLPEVASWRNPYNPNQTTNEKKYNYLDANGNVALVELKWNPVAKGTSGQCSNYAPDVLSPDKVIEQDGKYFTKPTNLANLSDFLWKFDKDNWPRSLVYYHPEYAYYEYCLMHEDRDINGDGTLEEGGLTFDRKMQTAETFAQAIEFGLIGNIDRPDPFENNRDPFFNSFGSSHELHAIHELGIAAMERDMNSFSDSKGIDPVLDIWQVTEAAVECPHLDIGKCPFQDECPSAADQVSFKGEKSDEYWNSFRANYQTLKKKIYVQEQNEYAAMHESFNGCIGDTVFTYSKYPELSRRFGSLWSVIGDENDNFCMKNPELYAVKNKVFNASFVPAGDEGIEYANECKLEYTGSLADLFRDIYFMPHNCVEATSDLVENIKEKANMLYFQECGQCPAARRMELLLNGLANNAGLVSNAYYLNCTQGVPFYNRDMHIKDFQFGQTCGNADADGNIVVWESNVSGVELTGKVKYEFYTNITDLGGNWWESDFGSFWSRFCNEERTIKLSFINPISGVGFDDIIGVCCLEEENNPKIYTNSNYEGHVFKFTAKLEYTNGSGEIVKEDVVLEGVVPQVDIVNCDMPARCNKTNNALVLSNLINGLVLVDDANSKSNEFISDDEIDLTASGYSSLLNEEFLTTIGTPDELVWTGVVSTDGMSFTGTINADETLYTLSIDMVNEFDYEFSNIESIMGLRPDIYSTTPESTFLFTAIIVKTVDGEKVRSTKDLKGSVNTLLIGDCYQPTKKDGKGL